MVGILLEIVIKILIYNALLKRDLFDCLKMLYAIRNIDDLQNIKKLASSQSHVKAVRLKDQLGKQNFFEDMKKVFGPVTKVT